MASDMLFARHDWGQPLQEDREWLTSITIARDLTEQRQCLRSKPRIALQPTFNMWGEDHMALNDVLMRETGGIVNHCDWSQMCSCVVNGSGDLVTDYIPCSFYVGMQLVVYGGPGYVALVTPTSFSGVIIGMPAIYPDWIRERRVLVTPRVTAYFNQEQEVTYGTAGKSSLTPRLLQVVTSGPSPNPHKDMDEDMVHARTGLEVMLQHPDWSTEVGHTFYRQGTLMDHQYGTFLFYPASPYPTVTVDMRFRAIGKNRIDWLRVFHDRVRGAQIPYIQPMWTEAFKVLGPGPAPTTQFIVKGSRLRSVPWLTQTQSFIVIVWADQTISVHQILGINVSGVDTEVSCSLDPFHLAPTPANIRFACLGFRARQTSDTLSITHTTDGLASATISSVSVKV